MLASVASVWLYGLAGLLIAWRVRARFRRLVGRQRLSKYRGPVTVVIFPALLVVLALPSLSQPRNLLILGAAMLAGAMLGLVGLRTTRFEAIAGTGLFYTPNARLGLALFALFAARLAFRLYEITTALSTAVGDTLKFVQSPMTLATFGVLAAYYVTYAIGLMRWRVRVLRTKCEREMQNSTVLRGNVGDRVERD